MLLFAGYVDDAKCLSISWLDTAKKTAVERIYMYIIGCSENYVTKQSKLLAHPAVYAAISKTHANSRQLGRNQCRQPGTVTLQVLT